MEYNLYFDYAAIIISVILIIYYGTAKKTAVVQNNLFMIVILLNLATSICDYCVIYGPHLNLNISVIAGFKLGYYIFHILTLPVMFFYVLNYVKNWYAMKIRFRLMVTLPIIVTVSILLTNPLTGVIFTYNESGEFVNSAGGFIAIYITSVLYVAFLLYSLFHYKDFFSATRRIILTLVVVSVFASLFVQGFNPALRVETFMVTFGVLIIFLFIQNPYDSLDFETSLYNKQAFEGLMKEQFARKLPVTIVGVILTDFDDVAKNMDDKGDSPLAVQIAEYIKDIENVKRVYRFDRNIFCAEIIKPSSEDVDRILQDIRDRFKEPWRYNEYDILYTIKLLRINIPDDVRNSSSISSIITNSVSITADKGILSVDDFDLLAIERKTHLASAVRKAYENNNLELVFTPIFGVNDKTIYGAGANNRFLDEEIGYIYSNEIIGHIEKMGIIHTYVKQYINMIIDLLKRHDFKKLGLSCLFVKIPSIMVIQSGMVESISNLILENNIDPKLICFEISEYMVLRTEEELKTIMPKLHDKGFGFCLEDYGSGFTNLASIYELPFDYIVISSGVIKGTLDNNKAGITLKRTIELASKLNMKTIGCGIDSPEHFEVITGTDCNYAKGKYYLDNITEDEFMEIIKLQKMSINVASAKDGSSV